MALDNKVISRIRNTVKAYRRYAYGTRNVHSANNNYEFVTCNAPFYELQNRSSSTFLQM